jgi:hypothetical protein
MIEEEGWSELRKYFVRLDQMLAEQTAMQEKLNTLIGKARELTEIAGSIARQ